MKEWEQQFHKWERQHRASGTAQSWGDYDYLAFKNKVKAVVAFWELQKYHGDKVGTITAELCDDLFMILHRGNDLNKKLKELNKIDKRKKELYFAVREEL